MVTNGTNHDPEPTRVLAIASAGGHWVQLQRLRPAWDGCKVTYVTTQEGYRAGVIADAADRGQREPTYFVVPDANRWQKFRLIWQLLLVTIIIIRSRPDAVISTGAAPGYFALRIGKLIGARTLWIDSIANADELSWSGQKIGTHCDLWLTQWSHLTKEGGPNYHGSVI